LASSGGGVGRKARGKRPSFLLGGRFMQDLIYGAVTIAFFVIAIAYVHFCEHVK
jgi:hypothetical protein